METFFENKLCDVSNQTQGFVVLKRHRSNEGEFHSQFYGSFFFNVKECLKKKTLIPAGSLVWTEFPEKTKRIPALIDYMVKSIFEAFAKPDKKKHPRIVQREKQKSLVWMVLCFVHLKTHAKSVLFFALKFCWRFLFF